LAYNYMLDQGLVDFNDGNLSQHYCTHINDNLDEVEYGFTSAFPGGNDLK